MTAMTFSSIFVAILLFIPSVLAVHPLVVEGPNFVDSVTQERYEIIGVDYQPGGSAGYKPNSGIDPLSNATTCMRDAIVMQALGLNCLRVYNLDPSLSHDACASIFNAAGIYMLIDVNSPMPNESLDAAQPWTTYNKQYLTRIFSVVENFMYYPNTLGFFGANEAINDDASGKIDPPYVRAVVRDLKNYITMHAPRPIPVGYSAADVRDILVDTWKYFQCSLDGKNDDPSRIDFFGLNSYSWCGADATPQTSGYDTLTKDFANSTVPVFFSEYGCNQVPDGQPRPFTEVQALYGEPMRSVMSGGLVYQWTEETNNFGLVQLKEDASISLMKDYDTLQGQLNKIDLKSIMVVTNAATNTSTNMTIPSITPPLCSPDIISGSGLTQNFTIPYSPPGGKDLINNGVPNPKKGSLVPVNETSMPVPLFDSNGAPITDLQLRILSQNSTNAPNGQSVSGDDGAVSSSNTTVVSPTPSASMTIPIGSSTSTGAPSSASSTSAAATMLPGSTNMGWAMIGILTLINLEGL